MPRKQQRSLVELANERHPLPADSIKKEMIFGRLVALELQAKTACEMCYGP